VSVIGFGIAQSLAMVSSAPFMMENSAAAERNALFSANFGLQTLVGFFGTLVGGYLPTWFGGLLKVGVESPRAYAATLGVTVLLSVVSILPLLAIREQRSTGAAVRSIWPWRNLSDLRLVARIFVPNIVISMGAAILIPYMNLFFKQTFEIPDRTLGIIFAVSSVVTGVATLASPLLAQRWGRIRALVLTQLASIPFLLTIGFAPSFAAASIAFWVRAALMNMGNPLYSAFAMEQVQERERATVSGLMGVSWNIGWTIGPFVSGYMQQNPNIGFRPIFVITCTLYVVASILEKVFFQRVDDQQRRAAMLEEVGVVDVTAATPRRGWRL
jgi:predicted MFS family arabinose efflux permease